VAEAELDALFYPDIGMDVFTYFLAFARLARVQFTTWGHPVTTGIPNMDYFVSTRHAEPAQAERFYSERLVEFDNPPSFYYRPRPPSTFDLRAHLGLGAATASTPARRRSTRSIRTSIARWRTSCAVIPTGAWC
jgi:hypothetical protein